MVKSGAQVLEMKDKNQFTWQTDLLPLDKAVQVKEGHLKKSHLEPVLPRREGWSHLKPTRRKIEVWKKIELTKLIIDGTVSNGNTSCTQISKRLRSQGAIRDGIFEKETIL